MGVSLQPPSSHPVQPQEQLSEAGAVGTISVPSPPAPESQGWCILVPLGTERGKDPLCYCLISLAPGTPQLVQARASPGASHGTGVL